MAQERFGGFFCFKGTPSRDVVIVYLLSFNSYPTQRRVWSKALILKFDSADQSECEPQVPTEGPVDPPRTRTP